MTPELETYIKAKETLLVEQFKVKLDFYDLAALVRCSTESSVDMAARKILKKKWGDKT